MNEALGLEDGRIPDSAFSASSVERPDTAPERLRLNSATAWSASTSDKEPWVQVDLGKDVVIRKIATQGKRGAGQHTKTYMLSSRADGETDWVMYKEDNVEKVSQVLALNFIFKMKKFPYSGPEKVHEIYYAIFALIQKRF